jgi:DNA polymerase I-like protein with 3'-5' exonuclease and polymerase domains
MHDEIIAEARVEIAEKVADILKESMVKAFEKLLPGVPFKVNMRIQETWG